MTDATMPPPRGAARAVLPQRLRQIARRGTLSGDVAALTDAAAALETPAGMVDMAQHEKVVRFFSESHADHHRVMSGLHDEINAALGRAIDAERVVSVVQHMVDDPGLWGHANPRRAELAALLDEYRHSRQEATRG